MTKKRGEEEEKIRKRNKLSTRVIETLFKRIKKKEERRDKSENVISC